MCTACALHVHRMRTARTPHALHAHRMYQVSLAQLDEAIGRAEARGRLACVKYYAPWCQSCFAIKPLYERTAGARLGSHRMSQTRASPHVHCMCLVGAGKMGDLTPTPFLTLARALTLTEGKMGEHVDFYEVDGGCARELIALADVRNFPVRVVSEWSNEHSEWSKSSLPGAHGEWSKCSCEYSRAHGPLRSAHPLHTHATCKSALVTSAHWCPCTPSPLLFCR